MKMPLLTPISVVHKLSFVLQIFYTQYSSEASGSVASCLNTQKPVEFTMSVSHLSLT